VTAPAGCRNGLVAGPPLGLPPADPLFREEASVPDSYPYELKLPLAPYRFEWRDEPAVDAEKSAGDGYAEERYTHADGTVTIIREYQLDGSYHIMSDRAEIELIDNAGNPYAADPISVVRLP
jgi:hypothetical protein